MTVETRTQTFVLLVSSEDLEALEPLDLRCQYNAGSPRCRVWAGSKSLGLGRYIKESADPRPDMHGLYVRHANGDTMDYRRENLAWSTSRSGQVRLPEHGKAEGRERPYCLDWKGWRMLFASREDLDEAKERLAAGADPRTIVQTGRRRNRSGWDVAGKSAAEWAMWLRARTKELSEAREWLTGARPARPYEDAHLRRMFYAGWQKYGTEECKLLAVALAAWLDRRAQDCPDLPEHDPGNKRRALALLKGTTMRDPFEDLGAEPYEFYDEHAHLEMPQVKASFSLESGVSS